MSNENPIPATIREAFLAWCKHKMIDRVTLIDYQRFRAEVNVAMQSLIVEVEEE